MRFGDKRCLVTALALLILLSFSYTWWLLRVYGINSYNPNQIFKQLAEFKTKRTNDYTNGLANQGLGFHIRQHGPYWVLYNYIKAEREFSGNDSITLVLHGEWMDLQHLSSTLRRWNGPVSLTLVTSGDDFARAKDYLSFIISCTTYGHALRSYVSVNFIMHEAYLPHIIPRTQQKYFENHPNCLEHNKFDLKLNYRLKRNLTYPSNLARNVGRLTSRTHFILSLEMDFFPSPGIPQLFIRMLESLKVDRPRTTVFVLPAFEIKYSDLIPERQTELNFLYHKYIDDYLKSKSLYILPHMLEWLEEPEKLTMDIFYQIKRGGLWLAYYISVNDYEPFYDETYVRESKIDHIVHMDLLESLDYDFYIVNMGFLLRRTSTLHEQTTDVSKKDKHIVSNQRKLMILKTFLMNFM